MNIAKAMIPKVSTVFLHENDTVRQGLETITRHGFTAVPVLNDREEYIGSVSEGDFLRHILRLNNADLKEQEHYKIGDILRKDFCPALRMGEADSAIVAAVLNQNFVPIVDDRGALCGILTRRRVISCMSEVLMNKETT